MPQYAIHLSSATTDLLAELDAFSGGKLRRRPDFGVLVELATQNRMGDLLEETSFKAKFLSRTYGIMQRIGRNGQGYDQLAREFSSNLDRVSSLIRTLLHSASESDREQFESTYFTMSPDSLQNLLALFYDLSWYKNLRIDTKHTRP